MLPFSPADLGLPPKFEKWRTRQDDAVAALISAPEPDVVISMPVGTGKSAVYMAASQLDFPRTAILTSTKGLQNQLMGDFDGMGLVDIRGRNNYDCVSGPYDCEQGSHIRCRSAHNEQCPYHRAYVTACSSALVQTNYTYWMLQHKYAEGLGPFDLLVCDEAHDAVNEICSIMATRFTASDTDILGLDFPRPDNSMDVWRRWAASGQKTCEALLTDVKEEIAHGATSHTLLRRFQHLRNLLRSLQTIALSTGDWVVERNKRYGGYNLDPLWPGQYTPMLTAGAPKRLWISATITKHTCELLNMKPGEYSWNEYPSPFKPQRSPVYYLPTAKVSRGNTGEWEEAILTTIDAIIGRRTDRKGIIHCPSYKLAKMIMEHSKFGHIMTSHEPGGNNAIKEIEDFKMAPAPRVLVSPAIMTGFDFKYRDCEYQIIPKLPFEDGTTAIAQARKAVCDWWGIHSMIMRLVQACGRGMRAEDDQCETFLLDSNFWWVNRDHWKLFPNFWRRLLVFVRSGQPIPNPPKRLN